MKRTSLCLLAAFVAASCSRSPAAPGERAVNLAVVGSNVVYAPANTTLPEPLQVAAVDAGSKAPVRGVTIEWRVTSGAASITPATSTTNIDGVASANFQPAALGTYRVRATSTRLSGAAPEFEVRIVPAPQLDAIEPAAITAGSSVTLRGSNFAPAPDHNVVLFDGVRGAVTSATTSELRVTVPACVPNRNVVVTVALGYATSNARTASATAVSGQLLTLQPGQARTFTEADASCIRVPGGFTNALYLFTVHNVAAAHAPPGRFQLRALNASGAVTTLPVPPTSSTFADAWELTLRQRERLLLQQAEQTGGNPFAARAMVQRVPQVGDRTTFNVITSTTNTTTQKVNATAQVVSARAAIFVDDEAPANGFTPQDLQTLANLFDNPIYATDVATFGEPSDVDSNQRIIILLTPRINALTPRGQNSFAAGYFYGCDLLARTRCSGSNLGEIFYSMVPDPNAVWSDRRTTTTVMQVLPPVLAHEFQHMIHFARRGNSADVLWLAEGLAHTAEELVGDALQAQGSSLVASFKTPNYSRAQVYLANPAPISLLADDLPGSLELRGAAWLLLKYLRGHYGGNQLLSRLTGSTLTGPANIAQQVGKPWATLVRDFGVALWADGAPQLAAPVDPLYTFRDFDPRAVIGSISGSYPLQPLPLTWNDFNIAGAVGSSTHAYFQLSAPAGGGPNLNFVLSGPRAAPLGSDLQLTILRVR